MRNMEYRELIAGVLTENDGGNGTRMEGSARLAIALVYIEAAKAKRESAMSGFPLSILACGECFWLGTGTMMPLGPTVKFDRSGERVSRQASEVAAAALDGEARQEWVPGNDSPEAMQQQVKAWVAWAVSILARNYRMQQYR